MHTNNQKIVVRKLNTKRQETWRYDGCILSQSPNSILIEAFFNRPDLPFHGIVLRENDRFIERYYSDRWYNIFEIHDRDDDQIKAYYCNVTTPAEFVPGFISYVDLALDLLVYPDGTYLVLDQDEFQELKLEAYEQVGALQALESLQEIARSGQIWHAVHQDIQP